VLVDRLVNEIKKDENFDFNDYKNYFSTKSRIIKMLDIKQSKFQNQVLVDNRRKNNLDMKNKSIREENIDSNDESNEDKENVVSSNNKGVNNRKRKSSSIVSPNTSIVSPSTKKRKLNDNTPEKDATPVNKKSINLSNDNIELNIEEPSPNNKRKISSPFNNKFKIIKEIISNIENNNTNLDKTILTCKNNIKDLKNMISSCQQQQDSIIENIEQLKKIVSK